MSLVSTGFLVFLLVGVIVYYLIPKKAQWAWLLILSYAYYLCSGYKTVVFILLTTIITFTSGILLERTEDNLAKSLKAEGLAREDKKALKEKAKTYKKRVVVIALLLVVENARLLKGLSLLLKKTIVVLLSTGYKQSCAKKR